MEIQKTNNILDEDIQALSWFANMLATPKDVEILCLA